MSSLGYYLFKSPLAKGKFSARTVINEVCSDNMLVEEMVTKNPERKISDIKEFLKEMVNAVEGLLIKGKALSIPNFLRISPSVKGTFDTKEDLFNPPNNWVDINCTVSSVFIDDFQKKITLEKTSKPNNTPDIDSVCDTLTNGNVLQYNYANVIKGDYMLSAGYDLQAIEISLAADENLSVNITADMLNIIHIKNKEILFNIRKTFKAPDWMKEGCGIFVNFIYKPVDIVKGKRFVTKSLTTVWSCVE